LEFALDDTSSFGDRVRQVDGRQRPEDPIHGLLVFLRSGAFPDTDVQPRDDDQWDAAGVDGRWASGQEDA
jgi:hypothetical protein